ncbi:MAG: DUF1722 domain-containing protein [Nitrospira sp. LK265]|nr:DUF523 and DUF1722 domain-containing protein [Nitrospira sp.]NGZ60537.1 DUF1722 domain-containing protein [Nitrospira sp. LK265]
MTASPIRLGISRCLLGDEVRFDGGHKKDRFLTDILGRYVEWVPVCPEVEAGLGTPREAMRLVGDPHSPRLLTIKTGRDHTEALNHITKHRIAELKKLDLSGYVFKKSSPSCGIDQVNIYDKYGLFSQNGAGIYAKAFVEQFPLIPVEEEGRFYDPAIRENFVERVFSYRRFQDLIHNEPTSQALLRFHRIHKYLLLSHSPQHYDAMDRLIGQADRPPLKELAARYGALFMRTLAVKATVRQQVNVLHHIVGYFKTRLKTREKEEIFAMIDDYHRGLIPLLVPVELIKRHVRMFEVEELRDQVYLNPDSNELMLRICP